MQKKIDNINLLISHPANGNRDRSSVDIGPCTWVLDRPCPDIDVKFYLFTRQNPEDRQYIHIDETLDTSNLTESNFDPFNPVKIIIHGYNADMFLTPLIDMRKGTQKFGQLFPYILTIFFSSFLYI